MPSGVGPRELWVGADAGVHNWLVYSGGTYAPWSDIHQDGFRLRTTAGYGRYQFEVSQPGVPGLRRVEAIKSYADAMIGYQARFGELTAKAFVGYAGLQTQIGGSGEAAELRTGFKGALELWLNLGRDGWMSGDFSFADVRESGSGRLRVGYRIVPTISLGGEAIMNHAKLNDTVYERRVDDGRVGLFARYEWFGGEISASGGIAADVQQTDRLRAPSAYGTMNWIVQF